MPAVFYTTDGIPNVEHPERDIAAITAYLYDMNHAHLGAGPAQESPSPVGDEAADP
jgi:hypothetical protein